MQPLSLRNRQKKGSTMKVLNLKKQTFLKKYQENPRVKNKKYKMYTAKHSESIKIAKMEAYQLNKEKVLKTFLGQVWHGLYFICTICQHSFYEQSVRLLDKQKYELDFSAELYDPITSFNQKVYICDICHKILRKRSIPCQSVCNKMKLDPVPKELQELKRLEKVFIAKRILSKINSYNA